MSQIQDKDETWAAASYTCSKAPRSMDSKTHRLTDRSTTGAARAVRLALHRSRVLYSMPQQDRGHRGRRYQSSIMSTLTFCSRRPRRSQTPRHDHQRPPCLTRSTRDRFRLMDSLTRTEDRSIHRDFSSAVIPYRPCPASSCRQSRPAMSALSASTRSLRAQGFVFCRMRMARSRARVLVSSSGGGGRRQ